MLIVTDKDTASQVSLGDQYAIDVWPQPPVSDEEILTLEARTLAAEKLRASLQAIIDSNLIPVIYTESQLNKMLEKDVVEIAISLGIKASIRDRKSDTIQSILQRQNQI